MWKIIKFRKPNNRVRIFVAISERLIQLRQMISRWKAYENAIFSHIESFFSNFEWFKSNLENGTSSTKFVFSIYFFNHPSECRKWYGVGKPEQMWNFLVYIVSPNSLLFKSIVKWLKTYFHRNFYKLHRNGANNILFKSYEKCETFSCWWFSLNPSHFQVISETARSLVLPLSRNRFFENAPHKEPELLHVYLNFTLFFTCFFCS